MGLSEWTVLIGRTGFDTISSIPNPTLSLKETHLAVRRALVCGPNYLRNMRALHGRGLHSSTFQLNLSRFCH